jgi:shikimate dehydrogenase
VATVIEPDVDLVADGTRRFLEAETSILNTPGRAGAEPVHLAAIGTTAPRAVRGELLAQAIAAAGLALASAEARTTPDDLLAEPTWQLGVVLSPWKQDIGARCDQLAPSAELTGVVDTVLRSSEGTVGFNTNTWAAGSALDALTGGRAPERLLILGAGASARSVALAVERQWPDAELVVAARSRPRAEALARQVGARLADDLLDGGLRHGGCQVVVNTTTWGETEASETEPLGLDLDGMFVPGVVLFDLNNRIGSLPLQALAAGCVVGSGAIMQRVTNACRAALLLRR